MEIRGVCVLLLLCVGLVVLNTAQGQGIPSCCLKVSKRIPPNTMRTVISFYSQRKNGRCEIDALVLYTNTKKKLCANPKILKKLRKRKIPEHKPA